MRANRDGADVSVFLTAPLVGQPTALAADSVDGHAYWAQQADDTIGRATFDALGVETVVGSPLVSDPVAIAVDGVAGKLYRAQTLTDRVMRADL